jgi:pimeloyl-ACP methyl ester carboxylesterase
MRLALVVLAMSAGPLAAQVPVPAPPALDASQGYSVFLRSQLIGREDVAIIRQADGWLVRGSNRLAAPLDTVTRIAEIHYTADWRPTRMLIEGTSRGQELSIKTTFADGKASSDIVFAGTSSSKSDAVAPDTLVLPNGFLGSYAALARRLVGQKPGAAFRAFIAPQGEIPMRLDGVFAERIETPRASIAATRYALIVTNPPPAAETPVSVWTDASGALLRMSVPSQMLELAREDVASAATRTTSFSLPTDEPVRIPASGFSLAATVTKPPKANGLLRALILVGGSGPIDRDGTVAGIPILGHLARDLSSAGFLVVRYDKRGVGQSGGRPETSTIADYAEDVRAIITWLEKQRKDVDKKRIGLVGHSEGAWVAMTAAARDKRVAAVALVAGVGIAGSDLVLEQQRHVLERAKMPQAEQEAKIAMQKQINAAVLKGSGWDDVPLELRRVADSPWFQSLLAYDPARVMKDMRQPVLIVQGELDKQVRPYHADRLADLARARKRKVAVDVTQIPGVNHLLVPAKTGEIDEYGLLAGSQVSPAVTTAITTWMARILG